MLLCLLVFIAISSVGCQSKEPIPEAKMFSLSVTVPEDVQEDKPFKVESALVNKSNSSWEIKHAADMVTYVIYDGEGQVQPKLNEFTLHAGSYKIVSKATFSIKHAGKDIKFEVTSTPVEIKLAPR
jgi:hypothetical protein